MRGSALRCMRRRERGDAERRQRRGQSISGGKVTAGRDTGSAALAWPWDGHLADQSRERDSRPAARSASAARLSRPWCGDQRRRARRRTAHLRPLRRSAIDLGPRRCDASRSNAKRDTGARRQRCSRSVSEGKVAARRDSSTPIVARPRDGHPTASRREGDPTPSATSSADSLPPGGPRSSLLLAEDRSSHMAPAPFPGHCST